MFKFAGISGQKKENIEQEWRWYGDDVIISKKVYHHDDDDFSFDYVYVIELDEVEDDFTLITIEMVMLNSSICDKIIGEIRENSGGFCDVVDIVFNGLGITMGYEQVKHEDVDEKLTGAMCAVECMDSLRGFFLDRAWNAIGTTGWDTIDYLLGRREKLFSW